MAKDLTKNLKKDTHKMMPEPEEKKTPAAVQPEEKTAPVAVPEKPEGKKKVGRPKIKTEKCKTINIAIPISMLEKMEVAKLKYSNNLTAYVNAVIKSDLDTNYEQYLKIQKLING